MIMDFDSTVITVHRKMDSLGSMAEATDIHIKSIESSSLSEISHMDMNLAVRRRTTHLALSDPNLHSKDHVAFDSTIATMVGNLVVLGLQGLYLCNNQAIRDLDRQGQEVLLEVDISNKVVFAEDQAVEGTHSLLFGLMDLWDHRVAIVFV